MNTSNATTINADFFKGENTYKQGNGTLARNVLRKDYQRFLYENGLPREFDQLELEAAAKAYKGPIEQERIRAARKERKAMLRAVQSETAGL